MNNDLIVRDDSKLAISFTPEAEKMRQEALKSASTMGEVTDIATNEWAVLVQADLKKVMNAVEKARVACKAPVLDFGRQIDAKAKEFRDQLDAELLRISTSLGDYQTLQQAKVRAAEAAIKLEQETLERERQEALVAAKSHEEMDQINEDFSQQSKVLSQSIPQAPKAEGQIVRPGWEITRINEMMLARARPDLVRKIEFDMLEIKAELGRGVKLPGIEAREIIKSSVRVPTQKAIEV